MKKAFFLIAFLFAFQLFVSLLLTGCNPCGPFEQENYRVEGINTSLQRIDSIHLNNNDPDVLELESFAAQYAARYDSLGFEVKNQLTLAMSEPKGSLNFGISSAFACSPPGPNFLDELSDIIITSNNGYTAQYPKGTNLKDLLNLNYAYYEGAYVAMEMDVNRYLTIGNPLAMEGLFLTFNQAPDEDREHDFTIKYVLKNGKVFESHIENVLVKK